MSGTIATVLFTELTRDLVLSRLFHCASQLQTFYGPLNSMQPMKNTEVTIVYKLLTKMCSVHRIIQKVNANIQVLFGLDLHLINK